MRFHQPRATGIAAAAAAATTATGVQQQQQQRQQQWEQSGGSYRSATGAAPSQQQQRELRNTARFGILLPGLLSCTPTWVQSPRNSSALASGTHAIGITNPPLAGGQQTSRRQEARAATEAATEAAAGATAGAAAAARAAAAAAATATAAAAAAAATTVQQQHTGASATGRAATSGHCITSGENSNSIQVEIQVVPGQPIPGVHPIPLHLLLLLVHA